MPVSLRELNAGIEEADFDEMAEKCTNYGKRVLPGIKELGRKEMTEIYRLAFRENFYAFMYILYLCMFCIHFDRLRPCGRILPGQTSSLSG